MEPVARAAAVYVFLVLLFRITGKRSLARITTFDLVLLLIIGEATQQALLGDDFSVTNAYLVVITLAVLNMALDAVKKWSPKADRFLEDMPLVIVREGKVIKDRAEMANVGMGDVLEAARHTLGLRSIDEIAYAVIEGNGEISIIPRASEVKR